MEKSIVFVNMTNATKKQRKQYEAYMYFQVWHNKVNTANFVILGVSNKLDDRINDENYKNSCAVIEHCEKEKIPCSGVMVHNSNGCYFHKK